MSSTASRTPKYRLHKPTGQAVVTIDGKDRYLGKHGTAESREGYDRLIAESSCTSLCGPSRIGRRARRAGRTPSLPGWRKAS